MSLPVSLRPWQDETKDENLDLREKISLINEQRDGFRSINQADLQAEVQGRNVDAGNDDGTSDSGTDDDEEADKGTLKWIIPKRLQMQSDLFQAQNQSLFAVDALSLITSKVYEPAYSSASPVLKDIIPKGSLSFEKLENVRVDEGKRKAQSSLFKGSAMSSLTESADALLNAATRLKRQVKSETEYWSQLLSLTSSGWPVYKPPRPNAPMQVKFVASEARLDFKRRGVADLKAGSDGSIKLARQLGSEPRTLRLRLCRHGVTVATSVTSSLFSLGELGSSLEEKVRKAQSSLFEEELYHEMALESRSLQPLGVKLQDGVLHLPVDSRSREENIEEYLVDLIPLDEAPGVLADGHGDDYLATEISSVLLRLLLSHVYHVRLRRRCQLPPPIGAIARDQPTHIIRPYLAVIRHFHAALPFQHLLSQVQRNVEAAKLPISFTPLSVPGLHNILKQLPQKGVDVSQQSQLHTMLGALDRPLMTGLTVQFGESMAGDTSSSSVSFEVVTDLSLSPYGSEYIIQIPKPVAELIHGPESSARPLRFSTMSEIIPYTSQVLSYAAAFYILHRRYRDWASVESLPGIRKSIVVDEKAANLTLGIKIDQKEVQIIHRWAGCRSGLESKYWSASQSSSDTPLLDVVDGWAQKATP